MSGLIELAERVEAASGPDRALDADVAVAASGDANAWAATPSPESIFSHKPGWWRDGENSSHCAPVYATSLDAAMTLVPEGWRLRQMNFSAPCADDRKWHLNLHGGSVGEDTFVGRGATPALALTAAALRARAAIALARKGEA